MKKNWFYLFLLMAIAVMPLTSCGNDDDDEPNATEEEVEQHGPNYNEVQVPVTAYDALSWLQGSLVVIDENDKVVRRVYGKPLDESQPTVISVPVADYIAAEETFLDWVAPDKEATKVEGGYDYNLTDAEGKNQGSVYFRSVEGEAGVVACMTVAPGTDLKQITEVKFINSEFWPENDAFQEVEAGKIYEMEGDEFIWDIGFFTDDFEIKTRPLPFYCIQGNTDGKKGILIWLSPDSNDMERHPKPGAYAYMGILNSLPCPSEAEKVLEIYNNNKAFWNNMLQEMDAKGYEWSAQKWEDATQRSEFLLGSTGSTIVTIFRFPTIMCLDLDEEKGEIRHALQKSQYWYRYMHIRTIPPVKK